MWGVCNTPLHRYTYWIDGWYRCAYVGAYCIRPTIVSDGNGRTFSDFRSIRLFLAEYLWGVCNTPLHGYAYWIDGRYRCACVGAYCIRPSIVSNGNRWTFSDFRSIHLSLTGWLWGVCNTPLYGYAYLIDGWCRCFQVGAYCIRPYNRFQRKRTDVFRFRVYSFIPYGMVVGRIQYAPTRVRVFDRWVV